ncbi:MAG: hypothetical protein U9N34_09075, partial [Candidatus Cloacimonadota bacterium]|nr:hypothetical protein [Candidatus Cloacimonadota bacterium]
MYKSKILLALLITLSVVLFNGCDTVRGTKNANTEPQIEITSYQGSTYDDLEFDPETGQVLIDESFVDTLLFQQSIFWHGYDIDGVIEGYAFRISKMDDEGHFNPVGIAQYESFNNDGWIYHYKEGVQVSQGQELGDNDYSTIWSTLNSTTVNFPANVVLEADSVSGDAIIFYDSNPFKFEIKCIDDRDGESEISEKYFFTKTWKPTVYISTTKGNLDPHSNGNLKVTGTGIELDFTMVDDDPYVSEEPYYFEYKIDEVNDNGNVVGNEGEWYSTFGTQNVNNVLLRETYNTPVDKPELIPNQYTQNDSITFSTHTRLIAKAIDYAGVVSNPDTVIFNVADYFSPSSVLYINRTFCLGEQHYAKTIDQQITFVIPDANTQEGIHYSTPFYINKDSLYTALWSPDFRVYMKWGWNGEYLSNDMAGKFQGNVLDETTNANYYCGIEYFDLQLDGEEFNYPELTSNPNNIITDENGSWLRVPKKHDIGQATVFTNLDTGD